MGSKCGSPEGAEGSTSPIIQRKLELDKVCVKVCVCSSAATSGLERRLLTWSPAARGRHSCFFSQSPPTPNARPRVRSSR